MAATDEHIQPDYGALLSTISTWPTEQQLALVQDILKVVTGKVNNRATRKPTLQQAAGLLAGSWPPPSDEEVRRWLDEGRTEKYG
jgi:hypothetical protein